MKQKNVCEKYGITPEELKEGVDRYSAIATPKWVGGRYGSVARHPRTFMQRRHRGDRAMKRFKIIVIDEKTGALDLFETESFRLETDREITNDTFYITEETQK